MRTFIVFVPLLALATVAGAKKEPEPTQPTRPTLSASPAAVMIAGFDSDGDTQVTRAEFDAGVERSFKSGDRDGDGLISLLELGPWSERWLGNAYALPGQYDLDRDGDDKVSPAEFRAEFSRRFDAMDKDRDGVLVRSELIVLTMPRLDPRDRKGKQPTPTQPPRE
ncbi:EF-hand domain-containing protein [Sphingomonas colocasiae]|uniref:EF-hand domain-containing protein n=1 Tax=Sphingomonas colocasiae TaxID=1848973 RepID=A0ABS7PIG3_9SPHN|nr:EF-hand domain-containing protein [Sphingomonas colocasiae]MBY8821008.1 EF-hand domain-containing protein [Sphingomonas colocasiae]